MSTSVSEFGRMLREWRGSQGLSQLDLSLAAQISSRHLSFIETGRSQPSRGMVLRLAETLDLPLRERNALLVAAGFAPAYRSSALGDEGLSAVREALDLVLASHEPYPAFVLDRGWNVLLANAAFSGLLQRAEVPLPVERGPLNVVRLVLDPAWLRPRVVNWPVVAHVLGHRLQRQVRAPGISAEERASLEDLLALPGVRDAMDEAVAPAASSVVIPLQLTLGGRTLSWFSTIATLGTPQDVTLDELMIESLFPADDATATAVRALVGHRPG